MKNKLLFWIPTIMIFLFEGVMVAFTSNSEMAVQGITSLGYPVYFGIMLACFKVAGSVALIYLHTPKRVKEWAYAGFGIDFIAAFVSLWVVNGFSATLLMPLVALGLLVLSYVYWNKLNQ